MNRRHVLNTEIVFVVDYCNDYGFKAKAQGHEIYTRAKTLEKLKSNIFELLNTHFGSEEVPHSIKLNLYKS